MFGINLNLDLDPVKKLEIGVIVIILGIAGFLTARWMFWSGNAIPTTTISWIEDRPVGQDATKRISRSNPRDPNVKIVATVFANYDGRLEIIETTKGSEPTRTAVRFTPDARREKYGRWQNQMDKLAAIKDPARRLIAYSACQVVDRRRATLMGGSEAGLTPDQRKLESEARTLLKERWGLIDDGGVDGTAEPKLFGQLLKALEAYRAQSGDPAKDAAKGALAARVMELGLSYLEKIDLAKTTEIQKYVDKVYDLLDSEQRQKMVEAATRLAAQGRLFPKAG